MRLGSFFYKKANNLVKRTRWYNETLFGFCGKFWSFNTYGVDVINLGSSSSLRSFDYSDINLKCFNWALPSQYLLADYEILKNYSTFLKKGTTVILGTCLFPLDGYDVTYFDDRYYSILYPSSIWHYSSQRMNRVMDMKRNPIKYYPIMSFLLSIKRIFHNPIKSQLKEDQFRDDARRWIVDVWYNQFSIDNLEDPLSIRNKDLINQSIGIISKINDFCIEKGFNFVIVIPPVSKELREWLTPKMRENYLYAFRNSEVLGEIKFLDYVDDSQFDSHQYFRDAYLMTSEGARIFTKRVLSDLSLI